MLSEQLDTTNKKVLVIDDDVAVRMLATGITRTA